MESSRRRFLQSGVLLAGDTWLRFTVPGLAALSQAACSARNDATGFQNMTVAEAREFEAIAARILPTTDTPGAQEAGVIWFFDQAFGTFHAGNLQFARKGMEAFQASIASGKPFSELDEALQDAHLQAEEQTPFFQLCWFMSLCGFFGMSKYGGNKDDIGWKLIDVDPHQHAFQSPFGYYDARYMEEHDLD
jgi:hypothetical protein